MQDHPLTIGAKVNRSAGISIEPDYGLSCHGRHFGLPCSVTPEMEPLRPAASPYSKSVLCPSDRDLARVRAWL